MSDPERLFAVNHNRLFRYFCQGGPLTALALHRNFKRQGSRYHERPSVMITITAMDGRLPCRLCAGG
jgi:hypothetical protein